MRISRTEKTGEKMKKNRRCYETENEMNSPELTWLTAYLAFLCLYKAVQCLDFESN